MKDQSLTGVERHFPENDVIVTKTDLGGRITYANGVFLNISDLRENEAIGAAHNIIRHPHMPAGIFRLLWNTLGEGREIFAYVLNRAMNGDHYWVLAHITPSFDMAGTVRGYHSNRRVPAPRVVRDVIAPLYQTLLREEQSAPTKAKGMEKSLATLTGILASKDMDYERFIFSLQA